MTIEEIRAERKEINKQIAEEMSKLTVEAQEYLHRRTV